MPNHGQDHKLLYVISFSLIALLAGPVSIVEQPQEHHSFRQPCDLQPQAMIEQIVLFDFFVKCQLEPYSEQLAPRMAVRSKLHNNIHGTYY
jgi:hypothetical protein